MNKIVAQELTQEAFEPYGHVITAPLDKGRLTYSNALETRSPTARASFWLSRAEQQNRFPLTVTRMERHRFSSQTFVALKPQEWLVLVAPGNDVDRPDMKKAQAFIARPGQGVSYRANTWHHPLTLLDASAEFAVIMWLDGNENDEEFVDVPPTEIHLRKG